MFRALQCPSSGARQTAVGCFIRVIEDARNHKHYTIYSGVRKMGKVLWMQNVGVYASCDCTQ